MDIASSRFCAQCLSTFRLAPARSPAQRIQCKQFVMKRNKWLHVKKIVIKRQMPGDFKHSLSAQPLDALMHNSSDNDSWQTLLHQMNGSIRASQHLLAFQIHKLPGHLDLFEWLIGVPRSANRAARGFGILRQHVRTAACRKPSSRGIDRRRSGHGHFRSCWRDGLRHGGVHGRQRFKKYLAASRHHGIEA